MAFRAVSGIADQQQQQQQQQQRQPSRLYSLRSAFASTFHRSRTAAVVDDDSDVGEALRVVVCCGTRRAELRRPTGQKPATTSFSSARPSSSFSKLVDENERLRRLVAEVDPENADDLVPLMLKDAGSAADLSADAAARYRAIDKARTTLSVRQYYIRQAPIVSLAPLRPASATVAAAFREATRRCPPHPL
jgi:hypothetical protein